MTYIAMPRAAHEHPQIVPVPAYAQPHGPASGAAALNGATALLASLNGAQKAQLTFDLNDPNRANWSNLPAGIANRTGLSIGEMSKGQRRLLFAFLASALGPKGYMNVAHIIAAEAFLSTDTRAKRLKWSPENYWLSFFGTPSADTKWGWQLSGHHLALNISIEGNTVTSMSPSFLGTEPAIFVIDGTNYEVMRDMHLAGYALFTALDLGQQAKADAGQVTNDVLTGPGQDDTIPPMIGLPAAEMTETQKALLLRAIHEWVAIQPGENAAPRMAELTAGINRISYAWTGTAAVNTPSYMRIQGPSLIIEMLSIGRNVAHSAAGGGHYHTIYRNPRMEYGG